MSCFSNQKSPVWEITGAEFTRHQIHTADGISIRFPRVTRERSDKTWEQATDLAYLQVRNINKYAYVCFCHTDYDLYVFIPMCSQNTVSDENGLHGLK